MLIDTNDNANIGVYEHCSEWADMIQWNVTPVLPDEEAGPICAKVWGPK
jgi:hypothetical protein